MLISTPRLGLREATLDDAGFFLALLNQPGWLQYIGDRHVHCAKDARTYIHDRLMSQYQNHGFGLWVMVLLETGIPVGLCGLVQRAHLPDPDLGYALLEDYQGRGLVHEAATGVLDYSFTTLGLARIAAIIDPDNGPSRRVLERLEFSFQGEHAPNDEPVSLLFYREAPA